MDVHKIVYVSVNGCVCVDVCACENVIYIGGKKSYVLI